MTRGSPKDGRAGKQQPPPSYNYPYNYQPWTASGSPGTVQQPIYQPPQQGYQPPAPAPPAAANYYNAGDGKQEYGGYPPPPNYLSGNPLYPSAGYYSQPQAQAQAPYPPQAQYPPQPNYQTYPPQPTYGSPPPQVPYSSRPVQTEEERGVLGALGGAAAGGFAGHKMGHGVIGTLGGAYAGHKLEEAYKHHNEKPSPAPSPVPQNYHPPPPPQYAAQDPPQPQVSAGGLALLGNFSSSSNNITLDGDYDLIASCSTIDGQHKLSSISLNQVLTNDNGNFRWVGSGGNFGASARNVRLVEGGTVLEAELADFQGRWNSAKTWLNEKITNENGELKYVG